MKRSFTQSDIPWSGRVRLVYGGRVVAGDYLDDRLSHPAL